ncbi:MAG: sigma-70 family RNA polymerase sigma factor [Candidatus Cloacimonetes bacterium]|nr:sigma-70 family RNA polymerase sigma factor [Candidatus Cloacimonadota bacterium]
MDPAEKERELLELCRRSPEVGFARLHARYLPLVWALCLKVLDSQAWAEDACQECFVRIWAGLSDFRGDSKLSTWIWTLSHRCILNLAQRESRGERRASRRDELDEHAPTLPNTGRSAADELERKDLLDRLLGELSPAQRSIVTLFYMQELSVAEVAGITGQSDGAVRVTLHRARQRMAMAARALEEK